MGFEVGACGIGHTYTDRSQNHHMHMRAHSLRNPCVDPHYSLYVQGRGPWVPSAFIYRGAVDNLRTTNQCTA